MSESPTSFGRYRISRVIGEGAMGTVFVAADDVLGREVAIKAIRPSALQLDGRARFLNEARAIAGLIHPNVVQVFDVGEQGDSPFLVMEMAAGGSLRARLERDHRLPAPAVRVLGIQIAHALAAAHARGIVHRDVKPANILEGEHGIWKLADFGVAHVPDARLTITGQFLGSPAYAAPESLLAGAFGPASDVYGLACTLFECATGAGPHDQGGIETRLRANDAERSIQAAALAPVNDPELAAAILRGLSRDPAERPSAAELATLLAEHATPKAPPPPPARSRRWLAAVIVGAIVIIGVALAGSNRGGTPAAVDPDGSSEAEPPPGPPEAHDPADDPRPDQRPDDGPDRDHDRPHGPPKHRDHGHKH